MTTLEMYNGVFTECFQVEAEAFNCYVGRNF